MSLKIRKARPEDEAAVLELLRELDLYYNGLRFSGFRVAEDSGRIVGIVQLEPGLDHIFLSSLGISQDRQEQGLASALLNELLPKQDQDIYLYTIIPDFFKKFGFEPVIPQVSLPSKARYDCQDCRPDRCVTMVRRKQ
ncbi:MAG: GNAT family N-acetyltransferase [Candidatus Saganbacteria bacterium]|nr:GNAT family N-acetyltransferase [Candidatus Saganbacteria bacterium]